MTADMALGLIAGWAADRLLGDPIRYHPVAGFGRAATGLERLVWRPSRSAGVVYTGIVVGGATGAAALLEGVVRTSRSGRVLLSAAVTWTVLGGRSLGKEALRMADAVARGDLEEARRLAPNLAGRDSAGLDGPELCRATVESVAENTADAVVGPLVWAAVSGIPGAVAYRAANTLDAMVGHHSRRYAEFGWAAARLDDLLTWPAARLASALAVALAPAAGGEAGRAWATLRRDGRAHPSPNAGRLEASFAGAFGVRLGGRNRYEDRVEDRPEIGVGPRPDVEAVRASVRLADLVGLAGLVVCSLAAWVVRR